MKRIRLALSVVMCLTCNYWVGLGAAVQGHPQVDTLLAQLHDPRLSNAAKVALLHRAKSDLVAKTYIEERLPAVLAAYGGGTDIWENESWGNAAQLAGDLKAVAAVPILCRRIDLITFLLGGPGFEHNFTNRAAVGALIQIGAPAVPAVIGVLTRGDPLQREEAAYVLGHIGTDTAWQALKARLPHETDRKVRERIEELLKHPPKGRT